MAQAKEIKKFKVIECTAGECMTAFRSPWCACDWCNTKQSPSDKGYYLAVLNAWYCEKCFNEFVERTKWYEEDSYIEERNFEYGKRMFNLND